LSAPPRIVFAGTPDFALPCLQAVAGSGGDLVAVYTQPDRPAGRGRKLTASAVKLRALELGVPVYQPASLRDPAAQAELAALAPDLMVVVAYGLILPAAVLQLPRHGCWNVHASLLPRWRGAAPIQRALLAGDAQTGVCLMQMERGLDTGPVLIERRCMIAADESFGSLHDKLAALGAEVLHEGIGALLAGEVLVARPQPAEGVCYASKIERADAIVDWNAPAGQIERQVRALQPWPVAEADLAGERIKLHQVALADGRGAPGGILQADRKGLEVACGEGSLRLLRLQRSGGRPQSASEYLNARQDLRR
jgi:methionyl-tRNA formyltransferase